MNKVGELLALFNSGQLTKYQVEKELSSMFGDVWVMALIDGEYVPVKYHEPEPEFIGDDYDDWLSNTL